MTDTDMKLRFFGQDVETLSREQLIRAVYFLNDMLREHQTPQAMHERSLGACGAAEGGDAMSEPREVLTQAILDNDQADSIWETIHRDDAQRFATAQLAALAAAGFEIVPKVRCSLCGGLSVTDSGECPDCPAAPKVE